MVHLECTIFIFMQITWLGHACFKIQAKDVTIITDPYDKEIGFAMPRVTADIVTVSHDHHDHNNVGAVSGSPFVIASPGEYEVKGVFIYGIPSWHDEREGKERGPNTIFLVEMEGMRIAHLGDLGTSLNNEQLEKLEGADIVLIPVGGKYTIDAKKAANVISQIDPSIVVPMHYKLPGLKLPIDGLDAFAKEMGVRDRQGVEKLKITRKDLQEEQTNVIILQKV